MLDKQIGLYEQSVSYLMSPRLTVIITTIDNRGRVNAAPFSFFTPVSYEPVRVAFSCIKSKHFFIPGAHAHATEREIPKIEQYAAETEETLKDTIVNLTELGEFGVSVLPIDYLHQLSLTASRYPYGVDELAMAGLTAYPSAKIKPPLIKEAKTGIECKVIYEHNFGAGPQTWTLVVGEGLAVHIDSQLLDGNEFSLERMLTIVNAGKEGYGVCTDFREEPYILYPDVTPMPSDDR